MLFISEQSSKELREGAQPAQGGEDARSVSAALHAALIPFSAERSCRRRCKHSGSETAAEGEVRGRGDARDESAHPADEKGGRMEQDGPAELFSSVCPHQAGNNA